MRDSWLSGFGLLHCVALRWLHASLPRVSLHVRAGLGLGVEKHWLKFDVVKTP